jgi:hypothetical protein
VSLSTFVIRSEAATTAIGIFQAEFGSKQQYVKISDTLKFITETVRIYTKK